MVRNYVRKTRKGCSYTKEHLEQAVTDIKNGLKTVKMASREFSMPIQTLRDHIRGTHGLKSDTGGRPLSIPRHHEEMLATGLKTMEKWGFGLSRYEVLNIVGSFVNQNSIKTPFKDGIPGEDWFLQFKKRNNLAIKKPKSVEYARKKMTDPFVVREYFELLKMTLNELDLMDKPNRIWNFDETSFCMDPSKTKVVGMKGSPSSRTTSGPGKDNTTVLSGCSAAGQKLPPLIIFKGKNLWDQWFGGEGKDYPGTKYAATPNGWMETDIFAKFFENTFIPSLGDERPVLLVYDGHSTHVGTNVIQIAIRENVTILKLPPHTSHLLQPLDLAVFKSMKTKWDAKLVKWQRNHFGQKLPKKQFSLLVEETWTDISTDIISSGFRKAGIYPFDDHVIPESMFDPSALSRWKKHNLPEGQEQEQAEVNPNAFEDLLLATVKQSKPPEKANRTRVAAGAEVISTEQALARLAEPPKKRPKKTRLLKTKLMSKKTTRKKYKSHVTPLHDSGEEEDEAEEPADNNHLEHNSQDDQLRDNPKDLSEGKWVLVKYTTKRDTLQYYVGIILSKNHSSGRGELDWNVKFVKYKDGSFCYPEIDDLDTISEDNVVKMLPVPTVDRRGNTFTFDVNFDGFKLF